MKVNAFLLLLLAMTGISIPVFSQQTGTISGRVKDADNGEYLPGAAIYLDGTKFATISDVEGNFILYGVPAGNYSMKVSYIGYEDYETSINLSGGQSMVHEIELRSSFIELQGAEVVSQRQGQMKALNMQKESLVQQNIVAQEQMESFPDLNTAEVLQRLPGVNISRDMGEGKFVSIRGTDPRFTQVKVNGEAIATPEDAERFVALNVISAAQLSSLEVTKSPTPKMDGEAIGG
ncbi:MAG: carboxypeptidase-like regulatory domain-containing protein, partial [Bacteroidales bacterium]